MNKPKLVNRKVWAVCVDGTPMQFARSKTVADVIARTEYSDYLGPVDVRKVQFVEGWDER